MADREKIIKGLECCKRKDGNECKVCPYTESEYCTEDMVTDALALLKEDCHNCKLECLLQRYDQLKEKYDKLLKEQDELLKHEYWRGYNNGRADERGLQEGTIMQTFSPD